ncbi:hypothetical protein CPAV1605_720 [seawater metagenome]|uniref:Uncharacterized protein n=1 Tax=seawater metagenome TaxID=1561972 RepID=A0A5E8CLK7_9ZZZZ
MYYVFLLIILFVIYKIYNSESLRQFKLACKGPYFEGNRLDDVD